MRHFHKVGGDLQIWNRRDKAITDHFFRKTALKRQDRVGIRGPKTVFTWWFPWEDNVSRVKRRTNREGKMESGRNQRTDACILLMTHLELTPRSSETCYCPHVLLTLNLQKVSGTLIPLRQELRNATSLALIQCWSCVHPLNRSDSVCTSHLAGPQPSPRGQWLSKCFRSSNVSHTHLHHY